VPIRRVAQVIVGGLLLVDGAGSGLWLAGLVPHLGTYDGVRLALLAARGLVAAVELSAGVSLLSRRAAGPALATAALLLSAALTVFETGFRIAPTGLDPSVRWYYVFLYALAAMVAAIFVRDRR
jgi:hypothetical protein